MQLVCTGVGFDQTLVLISIETGKGVALPYPYPCSKFIDLVSEVKFLCWLNFSTPSFYNKNPPQIFSLQPSSRWSNAECFILKQGRYPKILFPSTKNYSAQMAAPPSGNSTSYQLFNILWDCKASAFLWRYHRLQVWLQDGFCPRFCVQQHPLTTAT